jgi:hypothetical protein
MEFARLVTRAADNEFMARVGEYLDLEEFARFMTVTVWLSTLDSILGVGQNYYLHLHPETGKFQAIPWDLDHSFGQFHLIGTQDAREQLSIRQPWQGENRFLQRVFQTPDFRRLYLSNMTELNRNHAQPDRIHRQVDQIAASIRPAVEDEDPEKLDRFDRVVAGESVSPAGFGPGRGAFGGFGPGTKPIKGFVTARVQSVADQLTEKSEGQVLAGFGFGGFGRRRGPDLAQGPPGNFSPGTILANAFMRALDEDKDAHLTLPEFQQGFARWFASWNVDQSGRLTDEQLRAGINRDLSPFPAGRQTEPR